MPQQVSKPKLTVVEADGIEYVELPVGTMLYKGASECYKEDLRDVKQPVWFSTVDIASMYARNTRFIGPDPHVCVYQTKRPLRLLLVSQNNIDKLFIRSYHTDRSGGVYNHTDTIFPTDPESRKSAILRRRRREKEEVLLRSSVHERAKTFLRILFCTKGRFKPPSLPLSNDRFDIFPPGRTSKHKEDIEYCLDFCQRYAKLADSLHLDGYYADEILGAIGYRGLHEEVMLCDPYNKIRLTHKIPFGTASEPGRRTATGMVKNAGDVEKEVKARAKIKAFFPSLSAKRRRLSTTSTSN